MASRSIESQRIPPSLVVMTMSLSAGLLPRSNHCTANVSDVAVSCRKCRKVREPKVFYTKCG